MLKPFYNKSLIEAGIDEAGRGCFAGPVVAATVIFPKGYTNNDLNDSKQLKESDREHLRGIIEKDALAFAVADVSPEEIDEINILNATYLAMNNAVTSLGIKPD